MHDRSCGGFPAVLADGPASGAMGVELPGPVVNAQVGGPHLQDQLGPGFGPELLRPFPAVVELFDQRLHHGAGDVWCALASVRKRSGPFRKGR